jgi:hypothetical protein
MIDGLSDERALNWTKSSKSANTNCVEIAASSMYVLVRDSKDPLGPRLRFDAADWCVFVESLHRVE